MSRWRSSLPRRPEAVLGLLVACLLAGAGSARAQSPPPSSDEVRDLRVAKDAAGGVRLAWQRPATVANSYNVRRCLIASLRAGSYGNCVAEGLRTFSWVDPDPQGSVFYLVTGNFLGVEGSLGWRSLGSAWTRRTSPPCSEPTLPEDVVVTVSLSPEAQLCGAQVALRYPADAMTFVSATCIGAMTDTLPETNATEPGEVIHACVAATPRATTDMMEMVFRRGECPVPFDAFELDECILTGEVGCATPIRSRCEIR